MKRMIVVVVLLALLVPGVLVAQEELTLEGLAEAVAGLTERIEVLERLYTPTAVIDEEGNCQLAVGASLFGANGGMHPTTVAAYMKLSENQVPQHIEIGAVHLVPGVGVAITLHARRPLDVQVIEYWSGCEFQSHSRFWEEDYSGNVTYLD